MKIYIYEFGEAGAGQEFAEGGASHKLLMRAIPGRSEADILCTPQGKPYFAEGPHFSISHTGRKGKMLWAMAVSDDGPVGFDLQEIRPVDYIKIAERFFTAEEADYIKRLVHEGSAGDDAVLNEFYRIWCRKEAFVKYTGRGFAETGFDSFSVLGEDGTPAEKIRVCGIDAVFTECGKYVLSPDLAGRCVCVICSATQVGSIEKVVGLSNICYTVNQKIK